MSPLVVWPSVLGLSIFVAGIVTYRRDLFASARGGPRIFALGVVLMAAALATFSGEHFSDARDLARLVPKWLPGRLFIAYLVGVAHLAAALSFVARRAMRWSAPLLALMFALFVLLLHLPNAIARAHVHIFWIFPFRESQFALGAFSVFVYVVQASSGQRFRGFATIATLFTAIVVIFFGVQNILHPEFSPGVPNQRPTSAWVPLPLFIAYLTGAILVALGAAMLFKKAAVAAITAVGIFMSVLTIALYVPDLFLAQNVPQRITAINFVADTFLFAAAMFTVASAVAPVPDQPT